MKCSQLHGFKCIWYFPNCLSLKLICIRSLIKSNIICIHSIKNILFIISNFKKSNIICTGLFKKNIFLFSFWEQTNDIHICIRSKIWTRTSFVFEKISILPFFFFVFFTRVVECFTGHTTLNPLGLSQNLCYMLNIGHWKHLAANSELNQRTKTQLSIMLQETFLLAKM